MSELTEEEEKEIEKLRNPYESNREWRMRKDFLSANYGKFPVDRLVCLSNCYLNIELYGCRYPLMVMGQVNELSDGLNIHKLPIDNTPHKVRGIQMIKFVKSSESEETSNPTKTNDQRADPPKTTNTQVENSVKDSAREINSMYVSKLKSRFTECEPKPVSHTQVAVINSKKKSAIAQRADNSVKGNAQRAANSPILSPTTQHTEGRSELEILLQKLCAQYATYREKYMQRTAIDVLHMVAMKTKVKIDTVFKDLSVKGEHKFSCTLLTENVEVGHGECPNKKGAKHKAFEDAEKKFMKKHIKIERVNPEKQHLIASDEPFNQMCHESMPMDEVTENSETEVNPSQLPRKRKFSESEGDLSKFIIFEAEKSCASMNAMTILRQSADINKAELTYEFHDDSTGVRCRVTLDSHVLVEYMGTSRTNAKSMASERALDRLRQICWTIKIKQDVDGEGNLSRDQVMGEIQKSMESISDNNIGNRLLRKMGWKGGGVGAEGNKGSEVPVAVTLSSQTVLRREGLGLHSNMSDFKAKVKEVIQNYAQSDNQNDMAFSAEFSKEERAFIHQMCQRLGLKSQSRGAGNERYLCVSRRRSAFQLFNHLVLEGGATSKYELVPPPFDS